MEEAQKKLGPTILLLFMVGTLLFGAYFYFEQLAATPFYLWLFVPDCPLYAALAGFILLEGWENKTGKKAGALARMAHSPLLRFVIASACALYGSWTIFIFGAYSEFYLGAAQAPVTIALIIGHLGMVLLALLILPKKNEIGWTGLAAALLWLALNTFMDYQLGPLSTHPWLGGPLKIVVEPFTWMAGAAWPLLLYALADASAENKVLVRLRKWVCWD
ncbi:Uncharacterised protein [uncultured archaeon]|nr:Uncharacterised protein [uncultured archaeon]